MDLPPRAGRYDILRVLGQGGMGRVLLARDTVLGREVAIKVLRDDLGLPPEVKAQLFERMRNEARAAAALSHPNMVTLHDMGEDDALGLYLVFELIAGPTLRERLRDGPLSVIEVARVARQLGAALAHAHEAGVIHRDVKPENVMLARTGAKITDFGIARLPDSTLTRAGSVLGTPAYSAPEALAAADFGPLSDQFSLAATLYEALSGERAFPGEDALAVAGRIATEEPAPLGAFPAASAVLARAMAKDKARRFASCEAFGEALASALEQPDLGTPTPVRGSRFSLTNADTPPPRSSLFVRQTRRWQTVLAGAAVLVIAALIAFGRHAPESAGDGASLRAVASAFASAVGAHAVPVSPVAPAPTRPRPPAPSPSLSGSASVAAHDGGPADAASPSASAATSADAAAAVSDASAPEAPARDAGAASADAAP